MGKCKYGKIGEKYGRLTIIGEAEPRIYPNGNKVRRVLVQCDCGTSEPFEVLLNSLRIGDTTSCGCVHKETLKEIGKKKHKTNTYDLTNEDYGIGYTQKGEEFYFDKEDFDKIKDFCWLIGDNGYVSTRDVNTKKMIRLHRLIMDCPKGKVVDHINRERKNNCKSNLRICSQSENGKNLSIRSDNKSGVTGVYWNKKRKKWQANIGVNGKVMYLGLFENLEDAIQARLKAELKLYGTFSPNYEKLTQQQSIQNESSKHSEQQNTQ